MPQIFDYPIYAYDTFWIGVILIALGNTVLLLTNLVSRISDSVDVLSIRKQVEIAESNLKLQIQNLMSSITCNIQETRKIERRISQSRDEDRKAYTLLLRFVEHIEEEDLEGTIRDICYESIEFLKERGYLAP